MLHAVGLPELVTHDLAEYERRALELAREPQRCSALRQRLADARDNAPLFDSDAYCRHLEGAWLTVTGSRLEEQPAAQLAAARIS